MSPVSPALATARAAAADKHAHAAARAEPHPPPSFAAVLLAWLCTGLLGGHHFLLRRHVHGLLWLTSGGGFGVGWALDFFRLRSLRADAAGDRPAALVSRAGVVTPLLRPGAGGARGVAHYVAGLALAKWYYWLVAWGALLRAPDGVAHAAGLAAATLTVWAVDNASHTRGSSLRAVALAGAAAAAAFTAADADAPLLWVVTAAQAASCYTRRWRASDDVALSGRAALRITAALALLTALLAARLLALPGARERLWTLLDNLGASFGAGWQSSSSGGGTRAGFDFGGLARGAGGMSRREAARVLGVGAGADARAVREAFRRLSLQHHPDKAAAGGGGTAAAEAMQTRLNTAREVLLRNAATA